MILLFSLAITDHTLYFIEALTTRAVSNTMLKYIWELLFLNALNGHVLRDHLVIKHAF